MSLISAGSISLDSTFNRITKLPLKSVKSQRGTLFTVSSPLQKYLKINFFVLYNRILLEVEKSWIFPTGRRYCSSAVINSNN
jgi:hypothetical protein